MYERHQSYENFLWKLSILLLGIKYQEVLQFIKELTKLYCLFGS